MDNFYEWRLFCDEETLQSIYDAAEILARSEGSDESRYIDSLLHMFNGCFRTNITTTESEVVDWKKDGF